jgi:hypothetical protein
MGVRIPSGPPGAGPADAAGEAAGSLKETGETGAAEAAASDPVTRVAEDLAAGRIEGDEAVARILSETMDTRMIAEAPPELREEIATALRETIASDPHLRSLARSLGAQVEEP